MSWTLWQNTKFCHHGRAMCVLPFKASPFKYSSCQLFQGQNAIMAELASTNWYIHVEQIVTKSLTAQITWVSWRALQSASRAFTHYCIQWHFIWLPLMFANVQTQRFRYLKAQATGGPRAEPWQPRVGLQQARLSMCWHISSDWFRILLCYCLGVVLRACGMGRHFLLCWDEQLNVLNLLSINDLCPPMWS